MTISKQTILFLVILMSVTLFTSCKNSSVAPVQQPDEESIRNQLLKGTIIEENDVEIDGNHYSWIRYCLGNQGICLLGIKTEEEELVIPTRFHNFRISSIGVPRDESDPDYEKHELGGLNRNLMWNTRKDKILNKVIVSEGINNIYDSGFAYLKADEVILPESLSTVDRYAFMGSQVKKVVIKGTNTSLGYCSFTESLVEEIIFPDGYKGHLETSCLCRSGIRKINLPGNIIKIDYFFQNCKNLEEINFSANQKELIIPQCAFTGCSSLKSLTFPASVQSVTILPSLYADDQKEEGVETLIFLGKNTRLHCINSNDEEIPDYIPAGKIVAPKDSLAIHKAKNSKKISAFTTLGKKRIAEDVEFMYNNPEFYKEKKFVTLVPMKYQYL